MTAIYHLALIAEWEHAVATGGPYRRSTIDQSLDEVGFIHCSFADQVADTAARFYAGRDDVVLLTIDPERLGAEVKVEGGFPHVYGPIPVDAVEGVGPIDSIDEA
jgi:glutathione S-transferase